jgi:hypothetical protein
MLPAFCLYIAIALSSLSQTPLIAYDLATQMSKSERIEWQKLTDDDNNVKFVIVFYKMPQLSETGFERIFINNHKNCKTEFKK